MQERGAARVAQQVRHATFDKRGAGEAIDDAILELGSPVVWLLVSTVLAIGSVLLITLASTIGLQSDLDGDNGVAEFFAFTGGLLGLVSLVLYVLGLVGLVDGIRSLKARAQSRANHWKLVQLGDDS